MDQRLRVAWAAFGLFALAAVAGGDLDLSFGTSGKVITVVGGGGSASAIAIQPDGKIVAAGRSGSGDFALVRYDLGGVLDATFGAGGVVTTDIGAFDEAFAITLQADGKIVAAGTTAPAGFCCQFALARYNTNGTLDATFGSGGVVMTSFGGDTEAFAVAIQADGKIVAAGGTMTPFVGSFALARYNPNGSLDAGFGSGGKVTTDLGGNDSARGVAVLTDGRVVAVGGGGPADDFALALYNTNGSLDATFGTGGTLTTDLGGNDVARAVAIQPNGMIVVAGTGGFFARFALARYATNGTLDPGFDGDGKATIQFTGDNIESANGIAIQADGKIVVAGFAFSGATQEFAIARFESGGGPDVSFGTLGKAVTVFADGSAEALAVALQADGKIVAAGGGGPCNPHCEFTLARYHPVTISPPTTTTDAATNIAQTGATLNGTVNPNGLATDRRFEYGPTAAYGSTSPNLAVGSGSAPLAVSFMVTGLGCNAPFHFRAVGQNDGGVAEGGDLTFTTAACPSAGSNNISAPAAQAIFLDSASRDSMSSVRAETWYRVRLFASRSYQFSVWPVDHEQGADAPALGLSIYSDDAGTLPAVPAPTLSSTALEGSTNSNGDALPASMLFQPGATGLYKIRILRTGGGAVAHSINLLVRETTLFSPWTSRAAGFEGFIEMHNNTSAALSVTLRAYDGTGTLLGAGLTFPLQPNATEFRTASQVGVPGNLFAGIVLTHNGALGAIAANVTTLNGANGLSFDSPFTSRSPAVTAQPIR